MATIKVTQVKSAIGTKPMHRGTLRALGLRGIGQNNVVVKAKPARRSRAATTPKAAE
jgi:large subunit ribosomal protein L30